MEVELRNKIIELFEYRQLPTLIKFSKGTWDEYFYENLIQLQYDIYKLDHELETNWDVDMDIIADRWSRIHADLARLGVPQAKWDNYSNHIYKYQKHELEIRDRKLPTRLSMEYFYFYKSCDVKLLRRLIYDRNPSLNTVAKTADWRLFDLVTEINDDVEDVQEDTGTINGNRFLISMMQNGVDQTIAIFNNYLDELQVRNQEARRDSSLNLDYQAWTEEQVIITKKLVHKQAVAFRTLDVSLYQKYIFDDQLVTQ